MPESLRRISSLVAVRRMEERQRLGFRAPLASTAKRVISRAERVSGNGQDYLAQGRRYNLGQKANGYLNPITWEVEHHDEIGELLVVAGFKGIDLTWAEFQKVQADLTKPPVFVADLLRYYPRRLGYGSGLLVNMSITIDNEKEYLQAVIGASDSQPVFNESYSLSGLGRKYQLERMKLELNNGWVIVSYPVNN